VSGCESDYSTGWRLHCSIEHIKDGRVAACVRRSAVLDGTSVDPRAIPLSDDGGRHELKVVLGEPVTAGPRI
jgi:hypothetical protein